MTKRIPDYDYSQPGFYCNTICTLGHKLCFGKVIDAHMHLSPRGEIARSVWNSLPARFPHVKLDAFVCMPNHVHMIIELVELDEENEDKRQPSWEIVRSFKAVTTRLIRTSPDKPWFAWQPDTFESLLLTERQLNATRQYIHNNPERWQMDKFYKPY